MPENIATQKKQTVDEQAYAIKQKLLLYEMRSLIFLQPKEEPRSN
jgi:hypothetical protein